MWSKLESQFIQQAVCPIPSAAVISAGCLTIVLMVMAAIAVIPS